MIKVAVVGAGYFARYQISAWLRLEGAQLIGIVDLDETRRSEIAELFPGIAVFDNLDALYAAATFDILDVATPPETHANVVRSALGKAQLIICQKPFCSNLNEAKTLVDECAGSKSHLIVHENFRFQPWYRKIREILDRGDLGEVLEARFNLRPGDGQGGDAYMARQPYFRDMPKFLIRETGIHFVDVFRFLFGEPETVLADLRRCNLMIKGEDAGQFTFAYENGLRAHFNANRLLDSVALNPRLTMGVFVIEGTKGQLTLDSDGGLMHRSFGVREFSRIAYDFEDRDFGGDCVFHLQKHVVDNFDNPVGIENTADAYLKNLEIEEAIYDSNETGRRINL